MCRIAGIISKTTSSEQSFKNLSQMCKSMAHGGPDDEGIYQSAEKGLNFGHRRLSIIDLSAAGHQPMFYHNKQLVITFNGEIYNYQELKTELLSHNLSFDTKTDTEVILAGYKLWGTGVFEKLDGMFAFALFDEQLNTTFLVRDRSGIKPLYYSVQQQELIFASEVKAFKHTNFTFKENINWKAYFLAFGHIPEPYTTLQDVLILPKAHFLSWNHNSSTHQITPFYTVKYTAEITNPQEAQTLIRQKMEQAVKKHLIADAPIGVFLSGGIDSSLLTLLADKEVGEKLNTLAINFNEEKFSEQKYQQLIAKNILGKHTEYKIEESDFTTHFDCLIEAMDQPTNDGINSWFVNKCAKENGLKAVLSGIGANEIFGGYPSFHRAKLIRNLKKLPNFILKLALKLPSVRLKRLYYLSYKHPIGEYLFLRGIFTPDIIAKLLNRSEKEIDDLIQNLPIPLEFERLTNGNRISWLETNLYMQNQLLKDTDFMSMCHGVEVRVSYLDQGLLKATQGMSNAAKFNPTQAKSLLINSFKNLLPESIWNRQKMGFTFPFEVWLKKVNKVIEPELYSSNKTAEKLINQFKQDKLHWSKAFALYQVFSPESSLRELVPIFHRNGTTRQSFEGITQNE